MAVLGGVAAAAVAVGVFSSNGPAHVLMTPAKLGAYVRRPQLEQQVGAKQLQREVTAKSAGQARHVIYAVYEDSAGGADGKTPQIMLFIGGNLSGTSPGDFISSFTSQSKGATLTSAGSLGGEAACVSAQASVPGSVALCTWVDNDTFGGVAPPAMNVSQLAALMRAIRPSVEHVCCPRGSRSDSRATAMTSAAASTARPRTCPPSSRVLSGNEADASVTRTPRAFGRVPVLALGVAPGPTVGKSPPALFGVGRTGRAEDAATPRGIRMPPGSVAPTPVGKVAPGSVGDVVVGVEPAFAAIRALAAAGTGDLAAVAFAVAVRATRWPALAVVGTVTVARSSSAWPLARLPTEQVTPLATLQTENRGVRAPLILALTVTVMPLAVPPEGQTQIA